IAAHIDDIIEEERAAGRQDSEIEQLIARRFGNVDEIAREFATVYRARRTTLSFVSYSLLAFISIVATSAFVYSIQYGATRWLGGSMAKVFNRSHIVLEATLLMGLTGGYLALCFAGRLFKRRSFLKTICLITIVFSIAAFCIEFSGSGNSLDLIAGFLFAVFVRSLDQFVRHNTLRISVVLLFFAAAAAIESNLIAYSGKPLAWVHFLPVYLAMAVSIQFTGYFASVFDREILKRHFA